MPRVLRDPIQVRSLVSQGLIYSCLFSRCCVLSCGSVPSRLGRQQMYGTEPESQAPESSAILPAGLEEVRGQDLCWSSRRKTYEERGYGYSAAYRKG